MKAPILWKTKVKRVKVISNGNLPLWKGLIATHIPSSCGFMSEVIPPQSNLKIRLKSVSRAVRYNVLIFHNSGSVYEG